MLKKNPELAEGMAERLVDKVSQPPFSDMALSRLWVAHLFVTQALPITVPLLERQNLIANVIEKRQNLLLRGLLNDRAYFREQKTKFDEVSDWEKSALLLAMSCLAKSEYETWLKNIHGQYNDLLGDEYTKWLKENREVLFEKLKADYIIKSRQEMIFEMFSDLTTQADTPPF